MMKVLVCFCTHPGNFFTFSASRSLTVFLLAASYFQVGTVPRLLYDHLPSQKYRSCETPTSENLQLGDVVTSGSIKIHTSDPCNKAWNLCGRSASLLLIFEIFVNIRNVRLSIVGR